MAPRPAGRHAEAAAHGGDQLGTENRVEPLGRRRTPRAEDVEREQVADQARGLGGDQRLGIATMPIVQGAPPESPSVCRRASAAAHGDPNRPRRPANHSNRGVASGRRRITRSRDASVKPGRFAADNHRPTAAVARTRGIPVDVASAIGDPGDRLSLRLSARESQAPLLRAQLRIWLATQQADDEEIGDILLAASEAFTNAVVHARRPRSIVVHVDACVEDGVVEIAVRDHGRWREGERNGAAGLGLQLMHALMDAVDLRTTPEGTMVRLRRVLRPNLARVDALSPARLELLSRSPIFAPQPQATLERLARQLIPFSASAGDTIIYEGDHGELVYFVARGRLQVHAASFPVATLGPGDHAGEIALLHGIRRTATIVALEPVELYALPREDFLAAVTGHEASTKAARELVAMRLAELDDVLRRPPSPPPADRTARAAG